MEKTIKEWFESVKDDELRKQLLREMSIQNGYRVTKCLHMAILDGFTWNKAAYGLSYWMFLYKQALAGNIPMTSDEPISAKP